MTGCWVSWKCFVACLFGEESQQPTWPHIWHSRRATHRGFSTRHSSQVSGVLGAGNSAAVSPSRCSHDLAIWYLSFRILSRVLLLSRLSIEGGRLVVHNQRKASTLPIDPGQGCEPSAGAGAHPPS